MLESNIEIEVKIRLKENLKDVEKKLLSLGFRVESDFSRELNIFYDREWELKKSGYALRLREYLDKVNLTLKSKSIEKRIKERLEYEVEVSSFENMDTILKILGFNSFFKYKKERKLFRDENDTLATLDKTPFGNFLEIEGKRNFIEKVMEEMKISNEDIEEKNYLELFKEFYENQK